MKKLAVFLSTILVIAVVSISFTSCVEPEEPEEPIIPEVPDDSGAGIYKPGKKISKVYEQDEFDVEYLLEDWTWHENTLVSIDYYDEGEFEGQDEYFYDGDRLDVIRSNDGHYAVFSYRNKQYDNIKYYDINDVLVTEVIFEYNGNKVSKITVQKFFEDKKVISMINRGLMGKLFPDEVVKMVTQNTSNKSKGTYVFTISYNGDNIASVSSSYGSNITYSDFDNYSSPWYNASPFSACHETIDIEIYSKNNPRKVIMTVDSYVADLTLTYTYDGNFPVTIHLNALYGEIHHSSTTRIVYL